MRICALMNRDDRPLASAKIEHLSDKVSRVIGTIIGPFMLFTFLYSAPKPGKRMLVLNFRRDEWTEENDNRIN